MALGAIFTVILVLLSNIKITLTVFLTVVLTLVDIIGFLHFWGITIDIISCVNIVLAVGLCVDYSVHIAHAFLVAEGKMTHFNQKFSATYFSMFQEQVSVEQSPH